MSTTPNLLCSIKSCHRLMQSCITPSGGFTLGDTRKTSRTKQLLLGAMSSVRNHSKIPVFKKNLLQAEYSHRKRPWKSRRWVKVEKKRNGSTHIFYSLNSEKLRNVLELACAFLKEEQKLQQMWTTSAAKVLLALKVQHICKSICF